MVKIIDIDLASDDDTTIALMEEKERKKDGDFSLRVVQKKTRKPRKPKQPKQPRKPKTETKPQFEEIPEIVVEYLGDRKQDLVDGLTSLLKKKQKEKYLFTFNKIQLDAGMALNGITVSSRLNTLSIYFSFGFLRECPCDEIETELKNAVYRWDKQF